MLAIFIAQLKWCTHFWICSVYVCLIAFDSNLLKKLKRPGMKHLVFDNSKALEKTEKIAFFLYLWVSTAIFKLSPHFIFSSHFIPSPCFIPSPVRSPQSAVRSPCFILTEFLHNLLIIKDNKLRQFFFKLLHRTIVTKKELDQQISFSEWRSMYILF